MQDVGNAQENKMPSLEVTPITFSNSFSSPLVLG